MATAKVVTGKQCTLTVNSVAYTDQIVSSVLTPSENPITGVTFGGPYAAKGISTWTLDVEIVADWGETSSICEALLAIAETGTNVNATFVSATGASFALSVVPVWPSAGGPADGVQTVSLSFPVHGTPTETFS